MVISSTNSRVVWEFSQPYMCSVNWEKNMVVFCEGCVRCAGQLTCCCGHFSSIVREFVDSGSQAKVEKLKYLRILVTSEARKGVED